MEGLAHASAAKPYGIYDRKWDAQELEFDIAEASIGNFLDFYGYIRIFMHRAHNVAYSETNSITEVEYKALYLYLHRIRQMRRFW